MRGTALANKGVQQGRRTQDAVLEWWSGCRTLRAACSQKTAVVIGLNRQKALSQRRPPTITEPWDFASVRHLRRGSADRVPALTEGDRRGFYFEGEPPVCASGTVCCCGGLDPALTEFVGVVLSSTARAETHAKLIRKARARADATRVLSTNDTSLPMPLKKEFGAGQFARTFKWERKSNLVLFPSSSLGHAPGIGKSDRGP